MWIKLHSRFSFLVRRFRVVGRNRKCYATAMPLKLEELSAEPYGQGHLFEGVTEEEKTSRVEQLQAIDGKLGGGGLKGYLTRARQLLKDAAEGKNAFEGLTPEVPAGQKLVGESGPGTEAYAEFERAGMAEVKSCAFCLVAGGLGERLGYPGIKIGIIAEVVTSSTFIETYCAFIKAFQAYARKESGDSSLKLPLAIMTSGDTHEKTVKLFEEHQNFGLDQDQLFIMKQEKVPALMDIDARIAAKGGDIETKPHGHGDVHGLLHDMGIAKKWVDEGRKWLFVFQDTNPLPFRSLCAALGVSKANDFVMNSMTVPRLPGEAVGGICKLVNAAKEPVMTINVEYNQLDPLLKATPLGGDVDDGTGYSSFPGNINVLIFKIPEYSSCLERTGGIVPEFVNPKWADAEKTKFKSPTRLECMMQDFPRLCGPTDKAGFTQLERLMSFTCVKNNLADACKKKPPDCALSAEADIYESNARLLKLAGADVEIEPPEDVSFLGISAHVGAKVILRPSFGISLEDMKGKVNGKVRISKKSTLILDGDVTIDGLQLDGALKITGAGALPKDTTESNAGCPLVAIPDEELPNKDPSLQIRGYTADASTIKEMKL